MNGKSGSPRGFREQGNVVKKLLGTREQKSCVGDFRKREDQNRKNTFRVLGNKGKQRKFCWEKGNIDHPWETLGNGVSGP